MAWHYFCEQLRLNMKLGYQGFLALDILTHSLAKENRFLKKHCKDVYLIKCLRVTSNGMRWS
jgi:hypothetical protein